MSGILDLLTPTTIANYARGAWDGVSNNYPLFKEFKAMGRIKYDVGGTTLDGVVEAGRYQPIVSAPGMDLSSYFQPKVRHARWSFPWGEIVNATVIDRGMLRRNTGDQALVRLRDTEVPALYRDIIVASSGLAHQLLNQNGVSYSGTGLPFYGLPTLLHAPGATGLVGFNGVATATGIAVADTDIEATYSSTSGTYGGLSMERSALSGVDNLVADAWTPTLVNSSYTSWTGTNDDESNAVLKFTQYAVDRANRFSSGDTSMRPTFGLLDYNFFRYMGQMLAAKQTVYVTSDNKSVPSAQLGYGQHEQFHAGLRWFWDSNMTADTGYVLNLNKAELSIQTLYKEEANGGPLKVSGEEAGIIEAAINFDPIRRQHLISATIPGQAVFEPRYQVRIGNYS